MSASEAKSGKYTYYVCQSLMERDSGTSKTPRLNAKKIENTIVAFVEEMSEFLTTSELTETKAFVHSFVKEIRVKPGRAAIIYSMPTPDDSQLGGADSAEIAINGGVRKSVRHGGPGGTRAHDLRIKSPLLFRPSYQSAPGLHGSERQRPRPRPPNAFTLALRIRHRTHWCGFCEVDLRVDNPYGSETI